MSGRYRSLLFSKRHASKTGGALNWVDEVQPAAHYVSTITRYQFFFSFHYYFYIITFFVTIIYFASFLPLVSFALDTRNLDLRSLFLQPASQNDAVSPRANVWLCNPAVRTRTQTLTSWLGSVAWFIFKQNVPSDDHKNNQSLCWEGDKLLKKKNEWMTGEKWMREKRNKKYPPF